MFITVTRCFNCFNCSGGFFCSDCPLQGFRRPVYWWMLGRNPVVSERKYIYWTEEKVFRRSYFINIANSRREKQANALINVKFNVFVNGKLKVKIHCKREISTNLQKYWCGGPSCLPDEWNLSESFSRQPNRKKTSLRCAQKCSAWTIISIVVFPCRESWEIKCRVIQRHIPSSLLLGRTPPRANYASVPENRSLVRENTANVWKWAPF